MGVGPGHGHLAGLQGLAQAVQGLGAELRQFVEEQHPVVRQGDLAGLDLQPAAGQRRHGRRMMRGAERPGAGELPLGDQSGHRMDHGGLQQLGRRERRQQARQAGGHHRLAGAGRADEQQVVAPGRGDLQRPLGVLLALHVPQVGDPLALGHPPGDRRRQDLGPAEMVHEADQRGRGQDAGVPGPGGLSAAGLRADEPQAEGARRHRRRQGAGRRDDASIEGELPHRRPVGQRVGGHHPHGRHHRQGDGQVVVAAFFGQVGGRQVADDPAAGQRQAEAGEGGPDPLAALAHRLVAEPHHDEGELTLGELHLHIHGPRLHPLERHRDDAYGHCQSPPQPRRGVELSTTPPRDAAQIKNENGTNWEDETFP